MYAIGALLQWAPGQNDYHNRRIAIENRIRAHFQRGVDYNKIRECTQNKDEPVLHYFSRLKVVFEANSGQEVPIPCVDDAPFAQQFKIELLNGLKHEISLYIKKAHGGMENKGTQ